MSGQYLNKVEGNRVSINRVKKGRVDQNMKVYEAFKVKMNKQKVLYIVEKIRKKYGSVLKYGQR